MLLAATAAAFDAAQEAIVAYKMPAKTTYFSQVITNGAGQACNDVDRALAGMTMLTVFKGQGQRDLHTRMR